MDSGRGRRADRQKQLSVGTFVLRFASRLMRALLHLLLALLLLFIATELWLRQPEALVIERPEPTRAELRRARLLLARHDPRHLREGQVGAVRLSEGELNLLLNVGLAHLRLGRGEVEIRSQRLRLRWSDEAGGLPLLGAYRNLELEFACCEQLRVERLRIGDIELPARLADRLFQRILPWLRSREEVSRPLEAIQRLRLFPGRLQLVYRWNPSLLEYVQRHEVLLSHEERRRLAEYSRVINQFSRNGGSHAPMSLSLLLEILFQEVYSSGGDNPIAENRAALLAMTAFTLRRSVRRLLNAEVEEWVEPRRRSVLLRRRRDLSAHFLVSATLSLYGDTGLAGVLGLVKELDDAHGGSGFSFADLAADMAGVRFAERLVKDPEAARSLQRRLADGLREEQFMPEISGLPEGMQEGVFRTRFGGRDDPRYQSMIDEIERRLDACDLYR